MIESRLVKFIAASSGGQIVLINPAHVRCVYGPTDKNNPFISICFGDGEDAFVRVESDLETAAKLLGFQIVDS